MYKDDRKDQSSRPEREKPTPPSGQKIRRLVSNPPASGDPAPPSSPSPRSKDNLPIYPSPNAPNQGRTPPNGSYRDMDTTRSYSYPIDGNAPTIPPDPGYANIPYLPNPVSEYDREATHVTPAAFEPPLYPPLPPPSASPTTPRPQKKGRGESWLDSLSFDSLKERSSLLRKLGDVNPLGCLLYSVLIGLFGIIVLFVAAASFGVIQYFSIVNSPNFPDVNSLRQHVSQFETTRILDRSGKLLYEVLDPNAGRRTYIPLSKISPYLIAATIATEDKEYYNHPGFDPVAILRAFWQNYTTGEVVSGASTITQQLARILLLDPKERFEVSVQRKAREIALASEITRKYNKEEILEIYLNEIYYGNLAYGIEAASETYFHTTADQLNLEQAAFLAGLPQSPSIYDIYENREATLKRTQDVLVLMFQTSQEKKCIEIGKSMKSVCINADQAANALKEVEAYQFKKETMGMQYPHWVNFIRFLLEQQYDVQTIYRSGFSVYTTLDPNLQDEAEKIVASQVQTLADLHVTDGALVAIRPSNGEILAMVGSADFNNEEISGQVNMAISPRQPGSSIKPITYAAAFEKGWNPATLIWDIPSQFPPSGDPSDPRPPYEPENYDGRFHGPVTVRSALANSYNIPAVKTLQYVGIYEDPQQAGTGGLIRFAERMGITTLKRPDYGMSLTLGGGDVSLLELTSAYTVFANNGKKIPPVAITKIVDYTGQTVYEYKPSSGEEVLNPQYAYLITSILSDNEARTPMFGSESVLHLPFPAAAKTGTTNDFRDNWTIGYTPDLAVGVWVGNADYTPMINSTGLTGAAPIWSQFMRTTIPALVGDNPAGFSPPPGMTEKVICTTSGTEPSEWCPAQRNEIFASDRLPLPKGEDLWQQLKIDTWTGLKASPACKDYTEKRFTLNVTDPQAVKWILESSQGQAWAESIGFTNDIYFPPERECRADDPRPEIIIAGISEDQVITSSPLDIYAKVSATANFSQFRLEWGRGNNPTEWKVLVDDISVQLNSPERIYTWFLEKVKSGHITLQIYLTSSQNTYAEKQIHLNIQVPTPTPTLEPTEIPPTPTPKPTRKPTRTPTETQSSPDES